MQQVDVGKRSLIGQVTGDEHRQAFGVLWARGAVGGQAAEGFVFLHNFCVGRHDLGGFAVQRERDLARELRELLARRLDAAHDEFKMRVVVTLVFLDHQKVFLRVRRPVQSVRAVKHENFETGDAEFFNQHRYLFDVRAVHRCQMEAIVHVKTVLGEFQHLGVKGFVGPAFVQVVLAGAKVVQAGGDTAHRRRPAFAHRVFGQR